MKIAKVYIDKVYAHTVCCKEIPRGILGAEVELEYAEGVWDDLIRNVVFTNGQKVVAVMNAGDTVGLPMEVVGTAGAVIRVGVCGVSTGGETVIPTLWTELRRVSDAVPTELDGAVEPTLPAWAQMQVKMGDLNALETESKDSLVAALNEVAEARVASYLLTEEDSLNALLANGRYYCTGAVSNVLIRSLLEEAGIQIPEKMTREGIFACGLFVDVTRQERSSGSPEDVIGGPCQHLTVYFLEDKTTNYWVYEYDRAHDQPGSDADGTAWGKWYSPTHCGLEIEKEIFLAQYGETTTQEILDAVQAGKICFAVKDGDALPLAWLDGTRYARFASFYGGKSREIDVSLAKGWTESFTKYLAEEDLEGGLEVYMATFGTTTNQEIYDAYTAGKICFATDGTRVLPMLYCDGTRNATFANFSGGINQRFAVVNGTWAATYTRYLEEEALASAVEAALEQAKETFVAVYGETTVDEVIAAVEAGKICFAQKDSGEIWNMGSYSSGEKRVDFYRSYPGVDCELILTADGWTVSEKLRIKVPVVDERSTDDQIPTAKAVLDLFQSLDEAAALEDLAQAGFVAPVADENNAVFVDENNHIFTL